MACWHPCEVFAAAIAGNRVMRRCVLFIEIVFNSWFLGLRFRAACCIVGGFFVATNPLPLTQRAAHGFFRAYWRLCFYKTGNDLQRTSPGFQPLIDNTNERLFCGKNRTFDL